MITINDLQRQKCPTYQHIQGTCLCNECLCGQCKCKVDHHPSIQYPSKIYSNYQREYKWKKILRSKPIHPQQEYRQQARKLEMDSTYHRQFNNKSMDFKKQNSFTVPIKKINSIHIEVGDFRTSYGKDFTAKVFDDDRLSLKPIEAGRADFKMRCSSTYKSDYKERTPSLDERQRVKSTHSQKSPNLYMKSSYQMFYAPHQSQSQSKPYIPEQNQPFMPPYSLKNQSQYKLDFRGKRIGRCKARVKMESLLQQLV